MNEQISHDKSLTLKGLRTVLIFYFIMFSTSALIILIQLTYDSDLIISIAIIGSIISLLSLLGIYFGIQKIYKGNKEYGPDHEKSTLLAKKLIFWGIIFIFIIGFFITPWVSQQIIINAFFRTIVYVPFWLALVFLIKELSSEKIRNLLWFAFLSRFILYSIGSYIFLLAKYSEGDIFTSYSILVNLISIIPSFIFIYCYYITYIKIKNMEIFPG